MIVFWDQWKALRLKFILMPVWGSAQRPGAWPDADMLPLGCIGIRAECGDDRMTRFTHDEQRHADDAVEHRAIAADVRRRLAMNDEWTLSLLTNDEVLAVDQYGERGRPVAESGSSLVWSAGASKGAMYVAVFNVVTTGPSIFV